MIGLKSSLEVFAVLSETLWYSKISANSSRLLYKETDHESWHHQVTLTDPERNSGVSIT
jgi:hypothetical protein